MVLGNKVDVEIINDGPHIVGLGGGGAFVAFLELLRGDAASAAAFLIVRTTK